MTDIKLYSELHKNNNEYGKSGARLADDVSVIIDFLKPEIVLDYGCGKGALVNILQEKYPDIKFYKYDPAIEEYNVLPVKKADLVINTDVLEHIPEDEVENCVKEISEISQNVFFQLSHCLAINILSNGENAHCTVKPTFWYYNLFNKYFKTQTFLPARRHTCSIVTTFPLPGTIINYFYEDKNNNVSMPSTEKNTKKSFGIKNIFSITNEYSGDKKHKVIRFLGLKIKCKVSNNG